LKGGVLQLNMGKFADERLEGDIADTSEEFHVRQVGDPRDGLVEVWAPGLGVSESMAQRYAVSSRIIALGGEGIVSVASNEVPDQMSRMTELALAGDWTAARALHYKLLPLMEGNFIESNPGPVKAAMALLGLLEEQLRLPLVPVQESTRARLKEILGQVAA